MNKHRKKNKTSIKRDILIFILYTLTYIALFSFLDYYAFFMINTVLLITLSIVLGIISTYIHIKARGRSRIDDIADKF